LIDEDESGIIWMPTMMMAMMMKFKKLLLLMPLLSQGF
jgi:hypothetical protein